MAQPTLTVTPSDQLTVKVNETVEVLTETDGTLVVTSDNNNISIADGDTDGSKKITGATAGTSVLTFTATSTDGSETNVITVPVTIDKENGEAVLEVDQTDLTIQEGSEAVQVNVTTNADSIVFTSDNSNVTITAGSDNSFTVTPVTAGSSIITIKVTSKSSVESTATINVTVTAIPTLIVTPDTVDFKVGKSQVFNITTNQSDFGYVIEPSDIAVFDKDSKTLSALKQGTGKITFYVNKDQEGELSQVVTLNIAEADITRLEVNPTNPTIVVGGSLVLTVDTNADDYTVANTSTGVATFDKATKTLTAISVGSSTLTFTAKYGEGEEVTKTVIVTVEAAAVEATYIDVTTATPLTNIKGDVRTFVVDTNADDYDVELNNTTLADYDKSTNTLTVKNPGNLSIKFSATKAGSDTADTTIAIAISDTTLSASKSNLEVQVGEEVSFDITSNILGEVTVTAENEQLVGISKNNNRITINGISVGETNLNVVGRDKQVIIPLKVFNITELDVTTYPQLMFVGKDASIQVTTNADSYTVTSEHTGVVSVIKEGNIITLSAVSEGTTTIRVSAQVDGGDEAFIEWTVEVLTETEYTREEVDAILTDSNTTVEEKLNSFTHDKSEFGLFVNSLIAYNTAMNPNDEDNVITDEKGAARNYNLYIQMKDAIETEDYLVFKSKFDMINMVYVAYAKEAFEEFTLFKYDQAWASKWGELSLTTFQNLNTVICTLCNIKTRAASIDSISLDKSLDLTKIELSEIGVNNIKKYYTV